MSVRRRREWLGIVWELYSKESICCEEAGERSSKAGSTIAITAAGNILFHINTASIVTAALGEDLDSGQQLAIELVYCIQTMNTPILENYGKLQTHTLAATVCEYAYHIHPH